MMLKEAGFDVIEMLEDFKVRGTTSVVRYTCQG
jgi:hypothetical protein